MNHISCQSCRYWSGYCKKGKVAPKHDYKINSCIKWKLNFSCSIGFHKIDDLPIMTWADSQTYYRCKKCNEKIKLNYFTKLLAKVK